MYMLVFVTLMVALIGGYTQLYMKQASMGYSQQSGVTDAMLVWHSTARDLATKYVSSATITAAGCSLSALVSATGTPIPSGNFCRGNASLNLTRVSTTNYLAAPLCSGTVGTSCFTLLPAGYSVTPYTFYSLAYQAGAPAKNYVITYVPPVLAANDAYGIGLLCLPGKLTNVACTAAPAHAQVATTLNALYKEMKKNPRLSPMGYGVVSNTGCGAVAPCLITPPTMDFGAGIVSLIYPTPPVAVVPVGSIGIVSEITACTTC